MQCNMRPLDSGGATSFAARPQIYLLVSFVPIIYNVGRVFFCAIIDAYRNYFGKVSRVEVRLSVYLNWG